MIGVPSSGGARMIRVVLRRFGPSRPSFQIRQPGLAESFRVGHKYVVPFQISLDGKSRCEDAAGRCKRCMIAVYEYGAAAPLSRMKQHTEYGQPARTHAHARTHTHAHAHTHTHARTVCALARAHTHAHSHTRTRSVTHMIRTVRACTRRAREGSAEHADRGRERLTGSKLKGRGQGRWGTAGES